MVERPIFLYFFGFYFLASSLKLLFMTNFYLNFDFFSRESDSRIAIVLGGCGYIEKDVVILSVRHQ